MGRSLSAGTEVTAPLGVWLRGPPAPDHGAHGGRFGALGGSSSQLASREGTGAATHWPHQLCSRREGKRLEDRGLLGLLPRCPQPLAFPEHSLQKALSTEWNPGKAENTDPIGLRKKDTDATWPASSRPGPHVAEAGRQHHDHCWPAASAEARPWPRYTLRRVAWGAGSGCSQPTGQGRQRRACGGTAPPWWQRWDKEPGSQVRRQAGKGCPSPKREGMLPPRPGPCAQDRFPPEDGGPRPTAHSAAADVCRQAREPCCS